MLFSGKRLDFKVRDEYLGEGGRLKGSGVDLEDAYKQCPIHHDDYKNSMLVLKDLTYSSIPPQTVGCNVWHV